MKKSFAAVLALAVCGLAGCIMLPPPMPPIRVLAPAYAPVAAYDDAPPPMPVWDICEGLAEGAHPDLPGPRGGLLWGTCRRGASGALEFRPSNGR